MVAMGSPAGAMGGDFRLRAISAAVLGALALVTAWLGGLAFAAFWLAAAIATGYEWLALAGAKPRPVLFAVVGASVAGLVLAFLLEAPAFAEIAIGFVALVVLFAVSSSLASFGWSLTAFVYAVLVGLVPVAARALPETGVFVILWMFAVVWSTDIAAYLVGRTVGGPKLLPRVSPKKTWSGALAGLAGGTAAGVLVTLLAVRQGIALPASVTLLALAAALASVASQAGDLVESAAKRRFGAKNSGVPRARPWRRAGPPRRFCGRRPAGRAGARLPAGRRPLG